MRIIPEKEILPLSHREEKHVICDLLHFCHATSIEYSFITDLFFSGYSGFFNNATGEKHTENHLNTQDYTSLSNQSIHPWLILPQSDLVNHPLKKCSGVCSETSGPVLTSQNECCH